MIVILGVDPGLRATGYTIIQGDRRGCRLVEAGIIRSRHPDLATGLEEVHREVSTIMREYRPDLVVVEDLFSHPAFPRTSLLMAHARGVICLAAAQRDLPVEAFAPALVKRALTGSGRAGKDQLGRSVRRILGLRSLADPHASDAAALALTALSRRGVPLRTLREQRVFAG